MFKIDLGVNKKDLQDIRDMPEEFREGMLKGMRKSMFLAEAAAKNRMGRQGEIGIRSGHLRRSIQSGVKQFGGSVEGWIGSNVVYARIHELGGVIRPRAGKYLRFKIEGKWKTVKEVTIPARPYLQPSILENMDKIKDIIRNSIIKEVGK